MVIRRGTLAYGENEPVEIMTQHFMADLVEVDYPRTLTTETMTTITAHATVIDTKGDYSTLIASSSAAATMLRVIVRDTFNTAQIGEMLMDIATGGAGSESVYIPNIQCGSVSAGGIGLSELYELWFPVDIPAGTRISARIQDDELSNTAFVHVSLYGGGLPGAGVNTMGITLETGRGVSVTAATADFGSWVEIEDATPSEYRYVIPSWQSGETVFSGGPFVMQVGYGLAGFETVLYTIHGKQTTSETTAEFRIQPIFDHEVLPVGTRLAVRIQSPTTADVYLLALHGII